MIDTFKISKTFARLPNQSELISNGWKMLLDRQTGEPAALYLTSPKGEGKPRLTISQNPLNDYWVIGAEVSLGSWLSNSNLHLPDEEEFYQGLHLLSQYVESKSGIGFDAHRERVTRVDFTRDFQVGESAVIPVISKFSKLTLPRYNRLSFGDTSVYFTNSGKEKTKKFLIYSKYHERLSKSKNTSQLEAARGLIRLEISYIKSAVKRLAKSLKLSSHHANYILTKETSEKVIQEAMKLLHFDSLLTPKSANVEKLFEICDTSAAFSRIGFLHLKAIFGEDLAKQPFINISQKTLKRYEDDCRKAGILSLK